MCFGLLFVGLGWLEDTGIACDAEEATTGGEAAFDGESGTLPGSEFLREGVSAGLPRCGVAGADAEKTWLALREEKGKRPDDDEPAEEGCMGEGTSCSGVVGHDERTGEGERRAGRAERKPFDGRLVGDGACGR